MMNTENTREVKYETWMALAEFQVLREESPFDFSKPGGFANVVGVAATEEDFLAMLSNAFGEMHANVMEVSDVEVLLSKNHGGDLDPDILESISLLSKDNPIEVATIDYYEERMEH